MTSMNPYISARFNGDIWRMEIDELSNILFVEIRNGEDKQVSFASINLQTGHVNFKDLTSPERWLTGIEAGFDGVLLLYHYQTETGPVHKGIVAIDGVSGEMLWSNYTLAFDHLSVEGPIVYDTGIFPRKLFLADCKTGVTKRMFEPSACKELENNIVLPRTVSPGVLPISALPVHPYGDMLHCLDYNNFRIVSLHALKAGSLTQVILIMDGNNEVVYQDIINTGIQKLQPEAFIVHRNRLIYIKNRSELKVLSL